jgi:ubiquinone/menaquinone biosynthesis C-methylase UbiE/uncharacterized protein YbaR (Trm112 family)
MHADLTSLLRCAACDRSGLRLHVFSEFAPSVCEEGVLACQDCRRWFPIADLVLELLPDALADTEVRRAFGERHAGRLAELGLLEPDETASDAGGAFEVQAAQRRYFDDVAVREDRFGYRNFMRSSFWRAQDARMFARWLPQIEPGALVLDVGCGDGRTTFQLAGRARVVGFDLSSEQVRRAVERARREGVLDRFTFFVGDASTFPIADRAADYVLMDGVLHHLPEPARALQETARVLREGGCYFGKENNDTPVRPLFDWLQRVRPLWFEEAGPSPVISVAAIKQWGEEAGLSLAVESEVFLPPHAFGRLDAERTRRVLDATDRVCRSIPRLSGWGGILVIEGKRVPSAALAHSGRAERVGQT